MKFDFDYRQYQNEVQERLNRIFAESVNEDCDCCCDKENDETYCMIQKILNCPEMEKCHPYLYALDMENVNESDKAKVKKIFELGKNRGFIDADEKKPCNTDGIIQNECDDYECDDQLCGGPSDQLTNQKMIPQTVGKYENKPNFTVLYSASKEGNVSIGEFYSNAMTAEGAKEECMNQMTQNGYHSVNIMAIEQTQYGVDDEVQDIPSDVNMYEVYEDDAQDEKQETGDTSTDDSTEEKDDADETPAFGTDKGDQDEVVQDTSKDTETEKSEDEPTADDSEQKTDTEDKSEETENDKDEDKSEDTEEKSDKDELTVEQKQILKDEYTKIFKDVLKKTELQKSVQDMTLQERTDFYSKLTEKWTKNDPSEFMTDKEQENLNNVVIKEK